MMNVHKRICENLKEHIHPVNLYCTLRGIEDPHKGLDALEELVRDGVVLVERLPLDPTDSSRRLIPLYRIRREPQTKPHLKLVVDNTKGSE